MLFVSEQTRVLLTSAAHFYLRKAELFYSQDLLKSMCMYYLAEVVFLAALICITLLVFHTHTSRSTFVGIFCDVFGIILYGAPLTVMIGNGVGAILAVAQLIFYACYYGSTPKEGKPVKDPVKPTASQVQMIVSAV